MTTEADGPIRTERRGAALWLWLNRPNALNSLTLQMVRGLHQGLDLAADPGVRVVVIAGKGFMPAFAGRFTQDQMSALLAYLHTGLH
jgi:enoyl-CoA hydratase/carnithine racemase